MEQTNYITVALKVYGLAPNTEVPKVTGPFPTDLNFEVELFNSLPLDPQSHKEVH